MSDAALERDRWRTVPIRRGFGRQDEAFAGSNALILALDHYPQNHILQQRFLRLADQFWSTPPEALLGLEDFEFPHLKTRNYMEVRNFLAPHTESTEELNRLAYTTYLLFGTASKVRQFIKSSTKSNFESINIASVLRNIEFPHTSYWHDIDFRKWGQAFIDQHGLAFSGLFKQASPYTDPVYRGGQISYKETQFSAAAADFTHISRRSLAAIFHLARHFRLSANEFQRALHYANARDPEWFTPHNPVPPINIDGNRFNMPGYRFHILGLDSPHKLFVGHYTNSCEKVSDKPHNIENTILDTYATNRSAFFVISRGPEIVAHSWAWRGRHDEFVLDGFESDKNSPFQETNMLLLLQAIQHDMRHPYFDDYHLGDLMIGHCVEHLETMRWLRYEPVVVSDVKPAEMNHIGMNHSYNRLHRVSIF